jgi:hypothetical protein
VYCVSTGWIYTVLREAERFLVLNIIRIINLKCGTSRTCRMFRRDKTCVQNFVGNTYSKRLLTLLFVHKETKKIRYVTAILKATFHPSFQSNKAEKKNFF